MSTVTACLLASKCDFSALSPIEPKKADQLHGLQEALSESQQFAIIRYGHENQAELANLSIVTNGAPRR